MKEKRNLMILIMISSAIIGFIYEEIFYYFDLGYWVKRGSTYGPWIPIYAFGGLFIYLLGNSHRKKPWLVFLVSLLTTGLLEYLTGFILLKVFHTRLWDYNKEILNFGNIQGFICLRSVLLFGLSGLFIIYKMVPFFEQWIEKRKGKKLDTACYSILGLFLLDIIVHLILKL